MTQNESARDFSGFSDALKKQVEGTDEEIRKKIASGEACILPGQLNTPLFEPLPTFDKAECEEVYPSQKDLWGRHRIVFGRDRSERSHGSGYGGIGATTAGSIDIVVGSGGSKPLQKDIVGPNFITDAARVLVSQRTDIDKNFALPFGQSTGLKASVNRSAVGIKADSIRIVGREDVRIYTKKRTPTNPKIVNSDTVVEYNSRGQKIESDGPDRGIHLIAHEKTGTIKVLNPVIPGREGAPSLYTLNRLQPMVKGDNLVILLKEIMAQMGEIITWVQNFTNSQMKFNNYLSTHTHEVVGAAPGVAIPSIPVAISYVQELIDQVNNHVALGDKKKFDFSNVNQVFLSPTGQINILSRYNKTN